MQAGERGDLFFNTIMRKATQRRELIEPLQVLLNAKLNNVDQALDRIKSESKFSSRAKKLQQRQATLRIYLNWSKDALLAAEPLKRYTLKNFEYTRTLKEASFFDSPLR